MLSKRYESTEVDSRTCLHVPSGTHWSTSSDNHQVKASTKMYVYWSNVLTERFSIPYKNQTKEDTSF